MPKLRTPLCDLLGIDLPILQAPVGSASCPALAAAVSEAGGLGSLAMTWRDLPTIRALIRETRALTNKPYAVNLVLEWPQADRLEACLDEGARIVSFFWGDPSPHVPTVHRIGGLVFHTVSSAEDARRAVDSGVDGLIAQGWEAAGHVGGEVSTMALVPAVVDVAGDLPVIAAGGIADGRGIAAALALGAQGVSMGTRFLATDEARVHPEYRRRLLEAAESSTVYTELFDLGWPNAPHRVLRNSVFDAWVAAGMPPSGSRPDEGKTIARYADGEEVLSYTQNLPGPDVTGDLEAMPMYAGQSVGLVHEVMPAGQLVRRLAAEAEEALGRFEF